MRTHIRLSLLTSSVLGLATLALAAGCAEDRRTDEAPAAVSRMPPGSFENDLADVDDCADHADEDNLAVRADAARTVTWKRKDADKRRRHETVAIKLLGINDFHGQLASRLVATRPAGGAAVLASYLRAASAEHPDRTAIVYAGDQVGASPPSSALLQDEPAIQFFNALANSQCRRSFRLNPFCNLLGTAGNHEFDEGKEELQRLVLGGNHPNGPFLEPVWGGARYPIVSSNVILEESGQTLFSPLAIKILGGVPVAFIGAVLEGTPSVVTPTGVAGLSFLDEADAINQYVPLLKFFGINTIVVVIHQGGRQTSFEGPTPDQPATEVTGEIVGIVARLDPEVDVVVSGHSHAFTNALLPSADGSPILVTQAFSASTAFGEIDLVVDKSTHDVTEKSGRIVTTFGDVAPGTTPAEDVAEITAAAEEIVAPLVNRLISVAAAPITRTQNEAGESALGNLIADSQRAAMGTDLGFMNPGGIRADLDAGEVTWGDLFTVQPFGNSLVRMTLTGEEVKDLLEQQFTGLTSPRVLSVSGLAFTWSASAPDGSKVVEISVNGAPIDPAASYTVTANSFIAAGGDNFTVFVDGTDRLGGPIDLDALIPFIEALPEPFTAAIEGRVTRIP